MDVDFYDGLAEVDVYDFIMDNEWQLVGHPARKNVKYYPCCVEPYIDLTFTLKLKRLPRSFDNLLLAPGAILALLVPIIFLLPPETSDKTILGRFVVLFI